jgi:NAD(P)-dependent dehydrogenase (short-subunit alcohol dehydrogenase family)
MGNTKSALHKRSTALDVVTHFAAAKGVPVGELLAGRFAIVTGGNSGIGTETVKALAHAGCRVLMGSRTVANGEAALRDEIAPPGLGGYAVPRAAELVRVAALELEDAASVRAFADAARAQAGAAGIHLLVLNAGIMALPSLERTNAGWEKQL